MDRRLSRAARLGRAVIKEARTEKITFLAGSLAYHAFISLLPLLVLLLVAITALGNESLEAGFLALVRGLLSPGGRDVAVTELFITELRTASQSTGVSVIGGAVLVWGTMRIFRGIDTAFSDVYETETANTFLDQLRDATVVLVAFAGAVVVAGVLQRFLPGGTALSGLALATTLAVMLYPMYYVFPDTDVTAVEVVPGTVFAAVGLTLLESLFQLYLLLSGSGEEATVISGILVLLTWLYFASLVLLFGVVINAVLSNRSRDVRVLPVFGDNIPSTAHSGDGQVAAEGIRELEPVLRDGSSVTVSAGDRTVTFPAPLNVETDTRTEGFEFGGGQFGLTLRWAADAGLEDGPETDSDGQADTDSSSSSGSGDSDGSGGSTEER